MKAKISKLGIALVILIVMALLLSFPVIAEPVSKVINVSKDKITTIARTVFIAALGVWMVTSGIAALTVPVVGVALIVVGLVLVTYAVFPYFRKQKGDAPELPIR